MVAAGVIGGLYILCAVILSVGVREKRGEATGVRGGTGLLEEGVCTNPAGEAKPGASHSGSLGPRGGGTGSAGVCQETWGGSAEWQRCGQEHRASPACCSMAPRT